MDLDPRRLPFNCECERHRDGGSFRRRIHNAKHRNTYLRVLGIVLAAYLLSRQAAADQVRVASGAGNSCAVVQGSVERLFALSEARVAPDSSAIPESLLC